MKIPAASAEQGSQIARKIRSEGNKSYPGSETKPSVLQLMFSSSIRARGNVQKPKTLHFLRDFNLEIFTLPESK